MDKELKAKWVAALRSGLYQQATTRLRRQEHQSGARYCCLGVLCCVSGRFRPYSEIFEAASLDTGRALDLLSDDRDEARRLNERLWALNDEDGKSFDEIADHIEMNL